MKLFFVIFVSALALSAQDTQAPPTPPKAAPKPAAKAASSKPGSSKAAPSKAAPKLTDGSKPMAIPSTAVQDAAGDYHFTDPQGKKWIYRKTPWGVARLEDNPESATAQAVAPNGAGIRATEDGDSVRFERPGPFGVWKWEKKKSELDETEKAALQQAQANNQTGSKQE
jgi:hypothetical protein